MNQISLPFALPPLLLACGLCFSAVPAFASNAPKVLATTPSSVFQLYDTASDEATCLNGEAPPTVLARLTSALSADSLHQAEPGFVLIDDLEPAPVSLKSSSGPELASRAPALEQTPTPPDVTPAPASKASNFARFADIPHKWAVEAKAWTTQISEKFKVDESYANKVVNAVIKAGDQTGLAPSLLLAVIAVESNFNASARNGNARGLMQIIPFWHKQKVSQVGGPTELMKSDKNIAVGSAILKEYIDKSENVFQALTRYNASPHAQEYSVKVLNQKKGFDSVFTPAIR